MPTKVKSFVWRVCRNIIPTKANLCHRGVIIENVCEACGTGAKTNGHLFWECDKAWEVWLHSRISFETQGVHYLEFMDLVWYLIFMQHTGNNLLEMIFMIDWRMWFNRNATRHGSTWQSATKVFQSAWALLNEFHIANHTISP